MKFHILFCLPAASAATCCSLNVSGSRVAVSSERYSIFSLSVRTHFWITVGSAPSVNFWQIGHSRSPKYFSVSGAVGLPSVFPLWGMLPSRVLTCFVTEVCSCLVRLLLLFPPPLAIRITTTATTTIATTIPSWVSRVLRIALASAASSIALRLAHACSRRCLRVRSSSSLSTGLMHGTFTDFCSSAPKYGTMGQILLAPVAQPDRASDF